MPRSISPPAVVFAAALATAFFTAKSASPPTAALPAAAREARIANRPKVPGKLRLNARERREDPRGSGRIKVVERTLDWEVGQTAIIVCDMWDDHHCKIAAQRVGVMAPRMNQVLSAARDRGVMILFAPSETMNIYAGSPHRNRMEQARPARPPVPIKKRCLRDPDSEPPTLPEDTELDCDDCELGPVVRRHTRQHAGLDIIGFDGVSDSGEEIYNYCVQEGIKNVVLMGVHTNYCILARPYGIRQMLKLGMNVVLARDLTDALYDPRQPPRVSHARGTEIVVEHIERHLCPSILSADLTRVVPGSDGPVAAGGGVGYLEGHYTKAEYQIPMRDGVRLFTAVYTPKDTSNKYPILLARTQSGIRPYGKDQYPGSLGPSPLFAKEGYIFVHQDIRGRWMSEGEYVYKRPHNPVKGPKDVDESSDAYDTIDWLLGNVRGHNGKVGYHGVSYRGFLAAEAAIDAHPALKAVSPQAPVVDAFLGDDWHHNGAFFLSHAVYYAPRQGTPRPKPIREPNYSPFEFGTPDGYDFFLRLGPRANLDARYFRGKNLFWNELTAHPTYDAFWKARDLRPHLKNIRPALLTVGGWFDAENLFGALEAHRCFQEDKAKNVLVMGPWIHGGWNDGSGASLGPVSFGSNTAEYFREHVELPFFEYHLKGKGELKLPSVLAFETGTNRWRTHANWPPKGTRSLELYLEAGSRLVTDAPREKADAFDEYVSDPAKPVPYSETTGTVMAPEYMCADQRPAARRADVLVYEGDRLSKPVTLAGPVDVELHVSTTGTDSDWVVKVIDVYPADHPDPNPNPTQVKMGGYQQLVRGEVMRGRFRNSFEKPEPFVPGRPAVIRFRLPDVNHTFRAGHKIMVQVQSSWFPLVDRNPQSFVNIAEAKESDFRKATQRVYRSKDRPSRLVVRVLP